METLKLGSKGAAVKELQELLGITPDGVFGKATEEAVKGYQETHHLMADGVVGQATWESLRTKKPSQATGCVADYIDYYPLTKKLSRKTRSKILYIVIHYTAGGSSAPGRARKVRDAWQNTDRQASADFVVDDAGVLQANPDLFQYYTWAVGDGKGAYGITNGNSVSIEMCSTLKPGTSAAVPNHTGWSFTEAVLENTKKLVRDLQRILGVSTDRVVRHYDASRKCCPGVPGWNTGNLYTEAGTRVQGKTTTEEAWLEFKKNLG